MNLYYEMLKTPVFTVENVNTFYNNLNSSRSAVKRLMKDGLAVKIKNNMYTCISGETGAPVADRFQVACHVTPTAYLSHHTAMEYYGITDQVFYDIYISSETTFREFMFDGYTYRRLVSKTSEGVDMIQYSGGIVVTDLERTVVDSIKDMDKIAGLEETMQNIESIQRINETKLLKYLDIYQNQFLYQKTGCLLWKERERLDLSDSFFEICKSKIGKSKRYLTREQNSGRYNDTWKLVLPSDMINNAISY